MLWKNGLETALWTEILNTTGFTNAVAQDDLEHVSADLERAPPHLWARILDSSGDYQAIEWRNLPNLTEVLLQDTVAVELWQSVLDMSTPDVYDTVFNGLVARVARLLLNKESLPLLVNTWKCRGY